MTASRTSPAKTLPNSRIDRLINRESSLMIWMGVSSGVMYAGSAMRVSLRYPPRPFARMPHPTKATNAMIARPSVKLRSAAAART